jgi:hypothetical protein
MNIDEEKIIEMSEEEMKRIGINIEKLRGIECKGGHTYCYRCSEAVFLHHYYFLLFALII